MKRRQHFLGIVTALLPILWSNFASAAPPPLTPSTLPSTVQPGQIVRSLSGEQRTTKAQALPPLQAPKEEETALAKQAQKITFKLTKIILVGNVIYTEKDLLPLYEQYLNKKISVAQLFKIVRDITNYYRNNGYILSRAILPPQHVKNGIVKVQIVEGFIGQVNVVGDPKRAKGIIQGYGDQIKQSKPLQIKTMEKYLLLANQVPGVVTRAVLVPSKKITGASDVNLVTQARVLSGYISYDNYGTRYIGPQQITGNIGLNSSLLSGDLASFTYVKTPKGKELSFGDFSYNLPLGYQGTRWILGGNRALTNPLFVLAPSQVSGDVTTYYTTLSYPYIVERSRNLTLSAGFNYIDSTVTSFDAELYTDHIRELKLGGTYNFSDSWRGSNLILLNLTQGLPIWGYTASTTSVTTSRFGGNAKGTRLDLNMSRLQALFGNFSLFGTVQTQYSFQPLLASDQFSFGGSQLGRGYDPAEIIGDCGAAGSLELRYDFSSGAMFVPALQLYMFYDIGKIWNRKNVVGVDQQVSAASTGVGTRIYFNPHISGNLMFTQPVTKQVAAEELIGRGRQPRVFFSVVAAL